MATKTYSPIVQELIDMIKKNGWEDKFRQAFEKAMSYNTVEYAGWKSLDDYFDLLESNLHWIPTENRRRYSGLQPCDYILFPPRPESCQRASDSYHPQ